MSSKTNISKDLQELVSWSVGVLGECIATEFGKKTYLNVESIRKKMKSIRAKKPDVVYEVLEKELKKFEKFTDKELKQICLSFSLMLELINRCETAYRAYKNQTRRPNIPKKKPHAIIFVLTAHPTEARSPEILGLFENIQDILETCLMEGILVNEVELRHLLLLALKVSLARRAAPTVADEANNIYSFILKDEIIETLVKYAKNDVNVSLRTWVGGDKDGHPFVDENALKNSLSQSREKLIHFIERKLLNVKEKASYIENQKMDEFISQLEFNLVLLKKLKNLKVNDGKRVTEFKKGFSKLHQKYIKIVKSSSSDLDTIEKICWIFPALVVALEVREDSALVKEALKAKQAQSITRMLQTVKALSSGFEPKWYVRGFVLSMVQDESDVISGFKLMKKVFKSYAIPVVPLFENEKALTNAKKILTNLLTEQKSIVPTHIKKWGGRYEVMVGYSDSSKENGVLPSRIMISNSLRVIEKTLKGYELTPVFFHGSGGSIERGGGSLKEQTSWWPKAAIHTYKATIQGEMVARNFGNEAILSKQIQIVLDQLKSENSQQLKYSKELKLFSDHVRSHYSQKIYDDLFLETIEKATPYSFLHHLKIGSRPSKRAGGSIKNGLRAIPWILCWTQTRTLFPTWWGVGSAWNNLTQKQRTQLIKDYKVNPVLLTYTKALGFTLAKVELGVWKLYLEKSQIEEKFKKQIYNEFKNEYKLSKKFFKEITGEKEFLWFRPWLQQSIDYRSSMIHPLNLCQIESLRRQDLDLLRDSVTGVACGMLTTG